MITSIDIIGICEEYVNAYRYIYHFIYNNNNNNNNNNNKIS